MEHRELRLEELSLLSNFIESLKTENVSLFWDCLSQKCKEIIEMRAGPFKSKDKTKVLLEVKNHFGNDLEHLGIANIIEFPHENQDKAYGFFQTNVRTQIYYMQDTQVHGMKVPLELEGDGYKINILVDKNKHS